MLITIFIFFRSFINFVYFCTMQKGFLHLAYLLTKHECVILPGFGAFVVYPESHPGELRNGMFSAPALSLGFNPELTHNDGLLVHSMMKEQQISYNEAALQVNRLADELIACLKVQHELTIPGIGKLIHSGENKLNFIPATAGLTSNAAYYGLEDFYMPSLSELNKWSVRMETSEEAKEADIVHITLSRKLLRTVGSVAACALAFLLFSTPFDDHQVPVQSASLFPLVRKQYMESQELVEPVVAEQESVVVENGDDLQPETIAEPEIEATPVAQPETTPLSRMYYIVVASLPTQKAAEDELIRIIEKRYVSAGIVGSDGRYRIYVEKFEDKKQAETYLTEFRSVDPGYKEAWVLSYKEKM